VTSVGEYASLESASLPVLWVGGIWVLLPKDAADFDYFSDMMLLLVISLGERAESGARTRD
jgi:hypothetical protein